LSVNSPTLELTARFKVRVRVGVRVRVKVRFRVIGRVSINDNNLGAGEIADKYQNVSPGWL